MEENERMKKELEREGNWRKGQEESGTEERRELVEEGIEE